MDDKKITKEYTHQVDLEEIKIVTDILHHSGTNTEEKKKIETEQEAWRTVDALTDGLREKVLQQTKLIQEKEQALSEKDNLIAELMK